jgi:hypothetical protein
MLLGPYQQFESKSPAFFLAASFSLTAFVFRLSTFSTTFSFFVFRFSKKVKTPAHAFTLAFAVGKIPLMPQWKVTCDNQKKRKTKRPFYDTGCGQCNKLTHSVTYAWQHVGIP